MHETIKKTDLKWCAQVEVTQQHQPQVGYFLVVGGGLVAKSYPTLGTPWTVACQAPSPGDLPNPGIEPWSPALQVDSLLNFTQAIPKSTH